MNNPVSVSISVVIPTANRHEKIARAITKIYENTIRPLEVIVVDQSLNHLTFDVLKPFIEDRRIIYIKDKGTGAARSRNIGWKHASGDIIAFTDDDAWVDSKWLQAIQESFQRKDFSIGVLGGKIIPVYEEKSPDWNIPQKWQHLLPAYDQGDTFGHYIGNAEPASVNYAVRRILLEKFSGFDETLGPNIGRSIQIFGEDAEFSSRLKQSGFDIVYNPDCIVYHPVPLNRQNQAFLNKRLKFEGATYAYMKIQSRSFDFIGVLVETLKSTFKLYYSILAQKTDEACYLYGKLLILLKCGILKLNP